MGGGVGALFGEPAVAAVGLRGSRLGLAVLDSSASGGLKAAGILDRLALDASQVGH